VATGTGRSAERVIRWAARGSRRNALKIIDSCWKESVAPTVDQSRWLDALDFDVQGAQIDLQLALAAGKQVRTLPASEVANANARLAHHARQFVCSMRRVARVLENANPAHFPKEVSSVIKRQWRLKKAFFDQYTNPRNFIEHIAEEVRPAAASGDVRTIYVDDEQKTIHPVFQDIGLEPGKLVVGPHHADVSESALRKALEAREEVLTAAKLHLQRRTPDQLLELHRHNF